MREKGGERKREKEGKREGESARTEEKVSRIGRRVWVSVTSGSRGRSCARIPDGFSEVAIAYEVKVRLHDSRAT